jgi:hypothetical protein
MNEQQTNNKRTTNGQMSIPMAGVDIFLSIYP